MVKVAGSVLTLSGFENKDDGLSDEMRGEIPRILA